ESQDVETRLYDGFLNDADRQTVANIRQADAGKLATWSPYFHDERLPELLVHYKARNYPETLSQTELELWKDYRSQKLAVEEPIFLAELEALSSTATTEQKAILDQLADWHKKVMPEKK